MLRRTVIALLPLSCTAAGQNRPQAPHPEEPDTDTRLPNGKSQRDEILKADYEKSLQDASDLVRLSEELKADLEKSTAFVVSIQTIKKTDEIEKIVRRIRGRLKRA